VHGSGLGLYLGRRLAQANGGSLVIEDSAPGRGTNFALILPLVGAEDSRKTSRQTRAFD
jgi:signal transduction histidine kinase